MQCFQRTVEPFEANRTDVKLTADKTAIKGRHSNARNAAFASHVSTGRLNAWRLLRKSRHINTGSKTGAVLRSGYQRLPLGLAFGSWFFSRSFDMSKITKADNSSFVRACFILFRRLLQSLRFTSFYP